MTRNQESVAAGSCQWGRWWNRICGRLEPPIWLQNIFNPPPLLPQSPSVNRSNGQMLHSFFSKIFTIDYSAHSQTCNRQIFTNENLRVIVLNLDFLDRSWKKKTKKYTWPRELFQWADDCRIVYRNRAIVESTSTWQYLLTDHSVKSPKKLRCIARGCSERSTSIGKQSIARLSRQAAKTPSDFMSYKSAILNERAINIFTCV